MLYLSLIFVIFVGQINTKSTENKEKCKFELVQNKYEANTHGTYNRYYVYDVIDEASREQAKAGEIEVTCEGNQKLTNFDFSYNATLILKSAKTLTDKTSKPLKAMNWINTVIVKNSNITKINLSLLPNVCTKLIVEDENIRFIDEPNSSISLETIIVRKATNLKKVLQKFPSNVAHLVIKNGLLDNNEDDVSTSWPDNLKLLYVENSNLRNASKSVLEIAPRSIEVLSVVNNSVNMSHVSANDLPSQLRYFSLQSCGVVSTADLSRLQNLQVVNFRHNFLTEVPMDLPKKLEKLVLSYNVIKDIKADSFNTTEMGKLTQLYLDNNLLEHLSFSLPNNVEVANFFNNKIEYVVYIVFDGNKKLKVLDLSNNRLKFMVKQLPETLERVYYDNNLIKFVERKDFNCCKNALMFTFFNNQFVCTEKYFQFVENVNRHIDSLENYKVKCKGNNLNNETLTNTKVHVNINIIFRSFNCNYTKVQLKCENLNLNRDFSEDLKYLEKYPPEQLSVVEINNGQHVDEIPVHLYTLNIRPFLINFDDNNLSEIPHDLPKSTRIFKIRNNNISRITSRNVINFKQLVNLEELYLSCNPIKHIYDFHFQYFTVLKIIDLQNLKLTCGCDTLSLVEWFNQHRTLKKVTASLFPVFCNDKHKTKSLLGGDLNLSNFTCIPIGCSWTKYEAIIKCNSSDSLLKLPTTEYWNKLDLSNQEIKFKIFNNITLKNYKFAALNLSGTGLKEFNFENFPETIETIDLSKNEIETLPNKDIKNIFPNIKTIDLSDNKIKRIPYAWFRVLPNTKLNGNPFVCDCTNLDFYHWILTNNLTKEFEYLRCSSPPDLAGNLILSLTSQEICFVFNWKVLLSITITVVFVTAVVGYTTNKMLHRRRLRKERESIINAFKSILSDESKLKEQIITTNYKFDAFVSFHKNDFDFMDMLLKELEEKRGRRICFYERDAEAGVAMTANLVRMVTSSSRVICLLSREYGLSAWCKYQVQMSLATMHQRRGMKFVVPVLLKGATENKPTMERLQPILSAITGLPQPNTKKEKDWKEFWDKLDLTFS